MGLLNQISKRYAIHKKLNRINDGFQNSIYEYKDTIIRISAANRRSMNELESELVYIKGLADAGLPVSVPVASNSGHLIEVIHEQTQTFFVTAFEKAKGIPVKVTDPEVWNNDLFFKWGKLIGKIHHLSNQFQGLKRPSWSKENADLFNLLPRIDSELIKERYIEILEKLKGYRKESAIFGLIHNDFHQGNFFVHNGMITVFDFDDCAYNWFAYDLAVSYYHAYWQASSFTPENKEFSKQFWTHFLHGYRMEHSIQKEMLEQIPLFLKLREIFLYILFLEKWDIKEDWQVYTINDLKHKIENRIPFSDFNFQEIIDNTK